MHSPVGSSEKASQPSLSLVLHLSCQFVPVLSVLQTSNVGNSFTLQESKDSPDL